MEIDGWTPTLGAVPLLLIAAAAIALLLVLIMKLKLHAFPALILVSLLTAVATIPLGSIVDVMLDGFGGTLADVALLVGLGAMLGALLEVSGGARALAHQLISVFGERRAPLALGVASLLFGFPIFFDAGLVVMLPVVFSVARWVGGSMLLYGIPAVGAFSVMHVFVPPHPGPVTAASFFGASVGMVLLVGLVVVIPTWLVAVYAFSKYIGRRIKLPVPTIFSDQEAEDHADPPHWGTVVGILLLPMLLIFANTGLTTLESAGTLGGDVSDQAWFQGLVLLGQTPVALLLTLLVAALVLGRARGRDKSAVQSTLEGALPAVCSVILITGAGGMFGGVLRTSGIGDALTDSLEGLGIPLIFAGFLIAGILRVAQGSATVALTTAAGLISAGVQAGGYNEVQVAAMVVAVAAGSVILSHFNDSGFWLVGRFFQMDEKTTLKTWTVMETLIGVVGFAVAVAIFYAAAAFG
ncbi:GntP family permease [Rothia sp. AR01]|uniref:GntP family permease n=1 Tax=Rothia santali TaxID=2949643 RepID=A0A9X2HKY0_9MICC|nr:GntP family permease [Rothia santali]MCP3426178.1 GntP family permease [Rothia santali]